MFTCPLIFLSSPGDWQFLSSNFPSSVSTIVPSERRYYCILFFLFYSYQLLALSCDCSMLIVWVLSVDSVCSLPSSVCIVRLVGVRSVCGQCESVHKWSAQHEVVVWNSMEFGMHMSMTFDLMDVCTVHIERMY